MKTRCSSCQTTFRVTPEQLRARAGKVRCGQCLTVFNALDSLVEEEAEKPARSAGRNALTATQFSILPDIAVQTAARFPTPPRREQEIPPAIPADRRTEPTIQTPPLSVDPPADISDIEAPLKPVANDMRPSAASAMPAPAAPIEALVMPRETNEIPGYSKWAEGVMTSPAELPPDRQSSGFFLFIAFLLTLALAAQATYRFRSELAVAAPALRPWLEQAGEALGFDIPLPHRTELLSIEMSDLQNDAAQHGLLVLQATLRNRAPYAQAYPRIELTLTDTLDTPLLRRVLLAEEYLPQAQTAALPFAANADAAIRLWIEAKDIAAAGYRLYVFYP